MFFQQAANKSTAVPSSPFTSHDSTSVMEPNVTNLIMLVSRRALLYDETHNNYRDQVLTNNAWNEIADALKMTGSVHDGLCSVLPVLLDLFSIVPCQNDQAMSPFVSDFL